MAKSAHMQLRQIFYGSNTPEDWIAGVEQLGKDYGINIDTHETQLSCPLMLKGEVYEYCKKQLSLAMAARK